MVEFSKIVKRYRDAGTPPPPVPARPVKTRPVRPAPAASLPAAPHVEPEAEAAPETVVYPPIKPLFSRRPHPSAPGPSSDSEEASVSAARVPEESGACFESGPFPREDTNDLYDRLLEAAERVFRKDADPGSVDTRSLTSLVAEVASVIAGGDESLSQMAITRIQKSEDRYLLQHSINVCILSLVIGRGLGFEMGRMIELGLAAFLHDIGMVSFEDMANQPRKLTAAEFERIKGHVAEGDAILRRISQGLSDTILIVQQEIHERLDGSGYPAGKRILHDDARIIALADAFESMIHPRPFRPRFSIMDVYKRIFDVKNKFDQNFIKVLVNAIGFFPNGTFVQLNTKEIGRVVTQNVKSPLRPVVRLVLNENGEHFYEDDVKELNLMRFPTLHIIKCFLEDDREGANV